MKNKSFIKKLLVLLVVLITCIPQMWADSSVTGASIKYDVNASTAQWWNVSSTPKDLGQVYTFKLKGFWAKVGSDNVCQNTCIYYGLTNACSMGNYNIQDPKDNNWSKPVHFQTESMNVDILSGRTPNKYTLYAKFIGHGTKGSNSCADLTSSTYQMKFEYPAYLTGDGTWCGTAWNTTADAQKMTYNAGGYYEKTISSVTKEDHKLKVATYSWASSWGSAKYDATNSSNVYSESDDDGNLKFQPAMAGDVTIKFNISDQKISIICAAPTITLDDEGGSEGDGSLNTYYGVAPTNVTVPERDGYSFAGYWTGDDGTGTQVIGANGAWLRNVSNYTNNDATWKWIVRANSTLHAKWTQDPILTMNSVSPTTLVEGNTVTINVTRANSSAEISYEYKIESGSWTSLTPASTSNSGQTATWTIPESHGATRTFYFRAKMTDGSLITTDASDAVTVYGKKTIKVKDTNGWGANFKIHRWGGVPGTTWPGETTNITSAGGQWKQVVLYSSSTDFLFDNSSDPDNNKTANKKYADMSDGSCYVIQSGSGGSLTLTSTDCPDKPDVTTAAAGSFTNSKATLNASGVDANNDAITAYGFKWGTTTACANTQAASNLSSTTFSYQLTGLTAGTTYYFKAYATNGQGTTEGDRLSFVVPYKVTVSSNTGCTSITNSGTNYTNSTITVTATKTTGYTFSSWSTTNGTQTSTSSTSTTNTLVFTPTSDNATIAPVYTENMTTVNLVASPTGKGTFTSGGGAVTSVSAGVTTHPSVTAVPATGYRVNTSATVWSESSDYISLSATNTASTTITATGTTGNTATLTATFTPITYTIRFNGRGNTSGSMSNQTSIAYDASTNITTNAFVKTGYNFAGWATTPERAAAGTVDRADGAAHGNLSSTHGATVDLYAVWTPKQSALTLDKQTSATGYGSAGTVSTSPGSATYDAAMPTLSGTMPTAANGYAFMGFYDATGGGGTKYYNADGSSAHNWDKNTASGTTLYAYYKKAEITNLALDAETVLPEGTVGVTPTISPTPVGTTIICWTILYSNDTPLDPQPSMTYSEGKLTFAASTYSGTYKVQAVLRTGSSCDGGDALDTETISFQVAGTHDVTVNYKCGDDVIKASTTLEDVEPLDWSEEFTAPEIFGYTFARWDAADGVTIKNGDSDPVTTSTNATIQIRATYAGSLTANYTQNQMIYFKNTLGWENVYVNFHTGNAWINTDNGSGSPKGVGNSGLTHRNKHMIQIGESDVYYYDYGAESIEPSLYISFTNKSRDGVSEFWGDNPDGIAVVYPANYADAISTDKSAENGFKAATPMFVPLSGIDPVAANVSSGGKANYYNRGYWTTYTAGTGYTLEIYYDLDESSCIQSIPFTSADDLMPMKAVVDLEAGTTYRYQVRRGGTSSAGIYYGNAGTMTYANHGVGTGWIMENTMAGGFKKAKITTNASGNYTFNLSYSPNASNEYRLRMEVDYPIANGDYRLIYTDATRDSGTRYKPSAIVTKANNSKDTVSFFVRPGSTPVLKIQQATVTGAGAITWNDYSTISSYVDNAGVDALSKDSVYNICLIMNETGAISVENVEGYNGNFYIRTNAAGSSKWDNYRSSDHLMTYSEYSATNADYSHYFMAYVGNGTNVKFVVANDYSPCISDTVKVQTYRGGDASHVDEDGNIQADANVRFMWNRHNNGAYRAYLAAAKSDGSKFLVLRANSNTDLMDENGNALINSANSGQAGYNHKAPDNSMQFIDNENWIYETTVKIKPGAFLKLYANFHNADFYYKGVDNSTFDEDNAIQLLGGSGVAEKIRVIYDFKTDRLVSAWMPTGDIDEVKEIYADVMFVREHQGDIEQLTFSKGGGETMGAITKIETAYGVLRFNKWTLNNKSKADGHAVLDPGASRYERDLFYVSFPFRVAMNEVFGFGTYGKHWIIEYYDGAARAANGFWAETPTFWRFITDRKGKFFEPNQGYIIALDLDEMGESSEVWDNGVENVELYFPSYGTMGDITNAEVTYELPEHECTINRPTPDGDRRIKDSHWNVMSVPTYVNTSNVSFSNTGWTATRPSFLYEWNMGDNSLTARSGSGYTYHAMHAYIVQYAGDVTWTSTSVTPSSIVARERTAPSEVEFRLELSQNEQVADQAFVRLSNDEEVSAGFAFGEDMSKEFNKTRSNIYTFIGTEQVAGNVLPMSEQTTVVPVGVIAKTTGDYTFAIPEGTEGIGVTLIDNETGIRTSLSALTYTVNLEAGTYDERFVLEISPISQVLTDIDNVQSDDVQGTKAHKVMIDGLLYIVKDGVMYDARGARVE